MNAIAILAKGLVNLVYPLHCASCLKYLESAHNDEVCEFCLAKIQSNPRPYCSKCGRSIQSSENLCSECGKMRPCFESAYSACLYEEPLKTLIHKFKYNNRRALAGTFSGLMIDFIGANPAIIEGVGLITFVPLHIKKAAARGFNQSELLASRVGRELGVKVADCVEKTIVTKSQNELSREDRLVNVKGTFRIKKSAGDRIINGQNILLIDDVMTTGATLNEASRALIGSGAGKVRCLTLARGN